MAQTLAGKGALVTGGSRGIGRAIAIALAAEGAVVCVHYGEQAGAAAETVAAIEAAGGQAFTAGADLASTAAIPALADAVDAGFGARGAQLDILVNNAGIGRMAALGETEEAVFDALFAVNVKALFFLTRALLPRLQDGGRIINISSMVSVAAYPAYIAYAMTKASVNAFTTSLAAELGPRGITVNAIAPGATDTDFIGLKDKPEFAELLASFAAMKRLGAAEDIAGVAAFLASPAGGWVTGQVIQASGGMHL